MCLGDVAQVVELAGAGRAVVRAGGRTIDASLLTLGSPIAPGDWILVHSGFALALLTPEEAHEALTIRSAPVAGLAPPRPSAPAPSSAALAPPGPPRPPRPIRSPDPKDTP
jgi:hydrogenase expression/formation protein HypC